MAINFAKPAMQSSKPTFGNKSAQPSGGTPSWMKQGAQSHQAFEEQAAAQAVKAAQYDKLWRFFLKNGEERTLTFLDGDLMADGRLNLLTYHEHMVKVDGRWTQFVCLEEGDENGDPCPLCQEGDNPSHVAVFTVLDHTPYTIQKGDKAGTTIPHSKKLFVAKSATVKKLDMLAKKQGGLRGVTVEAARMGDKEPAVGSQFIPVGKHDIAKLAEELGVSMESLAPANYGTELPRFTAKEMVKMGIAKLPKGPGYEQSAPSGFNAQAAADVL